MIAAIFGVLHVLLSILVFAGIFSVKDPKKQLIYTCTFCGIEIITFLIYVFIK